MKFIKFSVLVIAACLSLKATSDQNELIAQCLDAEQSDQLTSCQQAALSINSSERSIQQLGKQLESQMNYQSAMAVYESAIGEHSHSKALLQSLIRARAAWRLQKQQHQIDQPAASQSFADQQTHDDLDRCFKLRYLQALDACRKALAEQPQNAALHARIGDVMKSMGRVDEAAQSYQSSLRIAGDDPQVTKKLESLKLISKTPGNTNTKATSEPEPTQQPAQLANLKANSIAQKQIELLDRLYQQKIISADEYEFEKQSVLAQAGSLQNAYLTPTVNTSVTGQQKLPSLEVGQYHALIIGNNKYRSPDFPDLYTAVNDAKKIASVLEKQYGFKTRVLLNADRYTIMDAVSSLRKSLKKQDRLLIYYAGHGQLDEATQQGYWLPVDAEPDSVANWVSANDVTDALTGTQAHHAIVIADSCFSASLLRNGNLSRLDERNALLVRLSNKRSRTVMTSGGLEPVQDDGGGEHSVFAKALIDILEQNKAVLEAGRLFVQLRNKVIINADQTPQYAPIRKAGHDGGDFIFIPI